MSKARLKKEIHQTADRKNIPWDDDPKFKKWSKDLTGKACLDSMSSKQLRKVKDALRSKGKQKSAEADLSISSPLDIAKTVGAAGAVGRYGGLGLSLLAHRRARDVLAADAGDITDALAKAKKTHPNVRIVLGDPSTADEILAMANPLKLKLDALRLGSEEKAKKKLVEDVLTKREGLKRLGLNTVNPMYVPKTNTIYLSNSSSPMALAHELGHASGGVGKAILQSSPFRFGAVGLGALSGIKALRDLKKADQLTDRDEQAEKLRSARNYSALAGAGIAGPTLLEEARANLHALKAAPQGSRAALLKKLSPGYMTYAAKRLPAALALPVAAEILRRRVLEDKTKEAGIKEWMTAIRAGTKTLKQMPKDEAAAFGLGLVSPIPGGSFLALGGYKGLKNVATKGLPGTGTRRMNDAIDAMQREAKQKKDWDDLVEWAIKHPPMKKTSQVSSHNTGWLSTKRKEKLERGSAFGLGFAAPVAAGRIGKKTVSGPFSGESFTRVSDLSRAAKPGDLLMVGQSKPVDIGRTIISLGTGLPHGYHAAIVGEVSRKKGTITIYDLTPKGYRHKEIPLTDMQHYSLFRPKNPKTAARAKNNMINLVRAQETLVKELRKAGMHDRAIKKVTDSMYAHKMNPVIGVRELFIPYVLDQTKANKRAVRNTERKIRMLRMNVRGIAKDIAEEWAATGRIDTEMLKPMQNVCTNTAAMIGIPVGPRSRATWAGPNDFLRSGKIENVGYRVSPRYRGFVKYFDRVLTASPHLIRAGVGLGLGSVMAGYVAAKQWAKRRKNRKVERKGLKFRRKIFIKGYTRTDGSVVKGHYKTASPKEGSYQRGLTRAHNIMGLINEQS